jgi:hypothetical protein
MRPVEFRFARRSADARASRFAGPCHAENALLADHEFTNDVVLGIGDDHVATAVDAEVFGTVERRLECRDVVRGPATRTILSGSLCVAADSEVSAERASGTGRSHRAAAALQKAIRMGLIPGYAELC